MRNFNRYLMVLMGAIVSVTMAKVALADPYRDGSTANPPVQRQTDGKMPDVKTNDRGKMQDTVLLDRLDRAGNYQVFLRAVDAAGLRDRLGTDQYTIFVPSDKAWDALPPDVVTMLMQPENRDLLTQVINYHIVSGDVPSTQLRTMKTASSLGGDVTVVYKNGYATYGDARVGRQTIVSKNGTIYTVDRVLLPKPVLTVLADKGYTVTYEPGGQWGRVMSSSRHRTTDVTVSYGKSKHHKHHRKHHNRGHHYGQMKNGNHGKHKGQDKHGNYK